ncbi:hypothetical protein COU80_02345 [Candidatus Peregrinibacteria bacterium CG10_big_fil_rev_8_21_14_0_10_55_24]|nr:MAG: hypothetical protein COU80_02345 [Candidatus Peregrinibacteria bacterium CG10_big_fil_rev_8_21_14_0_10_55_24]
MPRFDFRCRKCLAICEGTIPFGSQECPPCPRCNGPTDRLIAPPVIHFKGNGFYKTDSAPAKKDERKSEKAKEGKSQQKDEKKPKKKDSTKTDN